MTNKYGLSRHIPEDIKRQVRKAAGFGCVCCGIGIAGYEHINPEFYEAEEHNPNCITYLCGGCHDKVTRGVWSKDRVLQAQKHPYCLERGKPHDAFDISGNSARVWLGPNEIINVHTILQIDGERVLSIEPNEEEGLPFQISGKFFDNEGNLLFEINKNEWIGNSDIWDVECVGRKITIRRENRLIALQIKMIPPYGFMVERANYNYKGTNLVITSKLLQVTSYTKACIRILGRQIIGDGEGAVLIATESNGSLQMGPGPMRILGASFIPN
jgi:hypothetical protein